MLIQRLYLRNFRVYEDELDLALPPGLVGIYGPNGAGKSTLLEAILWTLWGKARTAKEHIRSAGVGGECVTEVEFEHEGHLYLVRRILKGANSAVSVEAHADGSLMSTGIRDAQRYIEQVLGMDEAAFRASVFTEQKQLAAFSDQTPAERRRLVLQLLGITPLDAARDAARKDARELTSSFTQARAVLPDADALAVEAADAGVGAEAAERMAADESRACEAAAARLVAATAEFERFDRQRQEHEALVAEGRAARRELDSLEAAVEEQRHELSQLESLAASLTELTALADGLDSSSRAVGRLEAVFTAATALDRVAVPDEPAPPDEEGWTEAVRQSTQAREELAAAEAMHRAAGADLERARLAVERSESLSGEADCPVCGQALGNAFEKVQAHRAQQMAEASGRAAEASQAVTKLTQRARRAQAKLAELEKQMTAARLARQTWQSASERRAHAELALTEAWAAARAGGGTGSGRSESDPPPAQRLAQMLDDARAHLAQQQKAAAEVQRIRGKLERRPALEGSLTAGLEKVEAAQAKVEALRQKVRALGFEMEALEQAGSRRDQADQAARTAQKAATDAAVVAGKARERAAVAEARLEDARRQHAHLDDLQNRSRHVSRVADLLGDFRNTVVASVGPRLAVQAADLFGELTDHEYEQFQVDADTYEVQIGDGGRLYGLDRFSGSEVDLANLAMRVAISEHIHFQSGGSVGLLVLDEVFGPLDDDRKARMLMALERLRGRFRQVLVVTHDPDIKEQLPNAVEVRKLAGRRATAKVLGD